MEQPFVITILSFPLDENPSFATRRRKDSGRAGMTDLNPRTSMALLINALFNLYGCICVQPQPWQ